VLYQQRELRNLVAQIMDSLLLGGAFWLAHTIRFTMGEVGWMDLPPIQTFEEFTPLCIMAMIIGPLILDARRIYRNTLLGAFRFFFVRLIQSILLILVVLSFLIFLFKLGELARGVLVLFALTGFIVVSLRHLFFHGFFDWLVRGKTEPPNVLLVGDSESINKFKTSIEAEGDLSMKVAGMIHELTGLENHISEWLYREPIDGVIFAVSRTAFDEIQKALNVCELEGVEAWVVTDYLKTEIARPLFVHIHEYPVLVFSSREMPGWEIVGKRVLDFTVSFVGLVVMLIPMLLVALLIRLDSPGPIFFIQERSGQRGKVFRMFKFRSMVSNAAMKQAELDNLNEMKGPVFKIAQDPRITKVGAFLRRTSLDEIPQLWNILKGDMSLVGPRPLPVYETQRIMDWAHRRRLSVKPGLTCLWQIEGRNQIKNFDDWVRLDLEYVDHRSFWLDFKILLRTIPVVLSGWGAR
jgi:exopolysaccharide biosynthesis polyprenyl glycosylphosphotransferase